MNRKDKRRFNRLKKRAGFGKYIIDCRGHPCIVTATNFVLFGRDRLACDDIFVKSLRDGSPCSCSLYHCAPEPISKAEAERMAKV